MDVHLETSCMDSEARENGCDNCGSTSDIAYTLTIHPESEDREKSPSETPSNPRLVGSSSSAIEVQFCSADCLCEWTIIPSADV